MTPNRFGEPVFDADDIQDLIMQGRDITALQDVVTDPAVDLAQILAVVEEPGSMRTWRSDHDTDISIEEFDLKNQSQWFMPQQYRNMDIAEHVLSLCQCDAELQRAGQELLMYQERGLMDLLRYMRYLCDVMAQNNIIWGVGRGSSVASFVLYLLGVHRVNSLYYDLDPGEFLR